MSVHEDPVDVPGDLQLSAEDHADAGTRDDELQRLEPLVPPGDQQELPPVGGEGRAEIGAVNRAILRGKPVAFVDIQDVERFWVGRISEPDVLAAGGGDDVTGYARDAELRWSCL